MALGTPTSGAVANVTSNAAITTGSFTPSASSLILAFSEDVLSSGTLTGADTITDTGAGLTWTPLDWVDPSFAPRRYLSVAWAQAASSSPPSMTVTSTKGAGSGTITSRALSVVYVAGADTAQLSNRASGNSAVGDPSVTLGTAPDAASTVIMAWAAGGSVDVAAPTNFTEINESALVNFAHVETAYDAGSAAATNAYSSTNNTPAIGYAIELKAAVTTYTATAASTMAVAVSGAVATETFSATAASTMRAATSAGVATETFSATAASTMAPAVSGAVATETFSAAAASTMAPATSASVAAEVFSAAAASTMAPAVSGAVAVEAFIAAAASTMAPAVSGAVATETFTAVAASTMAPATSAAAAVETVPGVFAAVAASTMAPARSAAVATFTAAAPAGEVIPDIGGGYYPPRQARVITARLALTVPPPQVALALGKRVRLELTAPTPTLRIAAHRGPTPAEEHHARLLRDDERLLELLDMAA